MFRLGGKKDDNLGGVYYTCPICEKKFDFRSFSELQGDHIWPYSLFGETTWENYQLICGKCNKQKGNHLDGDVHRVLGSGKFRELVSMFLQEKVETGGGLSRCFRLSNTLCNDIAIRDDRIFSHPAV